MIILFAVFTSWTSESITASLSNPADFWLQESAGAFPSCLSTHVNLKSPVSLMCMFLECGKNKVAAYLENTNSQQGWSAVTVTSSYPAARISTKASLLWWQKDSFCPGNSEATIHYSVTTQNDAPLIVVLLTFRQLLTGDTHFYNHKTSVLKDWQKKKRPSARHWTHIVCK